MGSSSSSPITITLPMFLEKGDTAALIQHSTKAGGWVDTIQDMVKHIRKVVLSLTKVLFIISVWVFRYFKIIHFFKNADW